MTLAGKRGALAAIVIAAFPGAAYAQEHASSAPVAHAVAVPYPEGAHGDAVVVLEVVVGADGRVAQSRVLAGGEPFLAATKNALPSFTFDPATRDGVAIAARIRIEIPFTDRSAHAPSAPSASNASVDHPKTRVAPAAPASKKDSVEDVRVRGKRKEIGGTTISKEEIRDLPGAFGDAFRAIDMLPGVTPIISGVPYFFVRGAPPGNTGYFVDDVRVPLLYHLALGPSVIHPSLIDRVDFYPGGYPAQYGRFTGGIVAGETRDPTYKLGGEAEVRLFDAGALGEAPFANGKGDALVAGRYGYPSLLVPIFAPNNTLAYWDYQGRVSYRVSDRDRVSAFVFGSFDELDQRDENDNGAPGPFYPLFRTEFHRADLRWDHAVPGGNLRTAITLGLDDSLAGSGSSDTTRVQAESVQLRTEYDRTLSKTLRMRAGADALLYHYDYSMQNVIDGLTLSASYPARNDVIFGGYADVVWRVHPRVEIVPGLRFDVFTSRAAGSVDPNSSIALVTGDRATAAPALDPRLAARIFASDRLTFVSTFAVTHQPPSFAVPVPGGELGALSSGLQSAVQASVGFEAKLPLDFELKSTVFLQRYFDMTNAFVTCTDVFNGAPGVSCLQDRTNGIAYGVEVMLRRSFTKRVAGWISYTLSRSTVTVPNPLPGDSSQVPSNFDRTHVLTSAFALDLGKGWHAGARFTYYTGLPYTLESQGVPIAPYNGYRLPDFWRIDLRLEKRWRLGARGQVALVFEGLNVTFNKEAISINCVSNGASPPGTVDKCSPETIGPVSVPSVGIEAKY